MEINVNVDVKDRNFAGLIAKNYENISEQKKVYVSSLGVCALEKYLKNCSLNIDKGNSLFKVKNILKKTDIFDINYNGRTIDIRTFIDSDALYIPKKHFVNNTLPQYYVFAIYDYVVNEIKIKGCIATQNIDKSKQTNDYYVVQENQLAPIETLVLDLSQLTPQSNDYKLDEMSGIFAAILDGTLDNDAELKIINYMYNLDNFRCQFTDFVQFEELAQKTAQYPDLFEQNDNLGNDLYVKDFVKAGLGEYMPQQEQVKTEIIPEEETVTSDETEDFSDNQILEQDKIEDDEKTTEALLVELEADNKITEENTNNENNIIDNFVDAATDTTVGLSAANLGAAGLATTEAAESFAAGISAMQAGEELVENVIEAFPFKQESDKDNIKDIVNNEDDTLDNDDNQGTEQEQEQEEESEQKPEVLNTDTLFENYSDNLSQGIEELQKEDFEEDLLSEGTPIDEQIHSSENKSTFEEYNTDSTENQIGTDDLEIIDDDIQEEFNKQDAPYIDSDNIDTQSTDIEFIENDETEISSELDIPKISDNTDLTEDDNLLFTENDTEIDSYEKNTAEDLQLSEENDLIIEDDYENSLAATQTDNDINNEESLEEDNNEDFDILSENDNTDDIIFNSDTYSNEEIEAEFIEPMDETHYPLIEEPNEDDSFTIIDEENIDNDNIIEQIEENPQDNILNNELSDEDIESLDKIENEAEPIFEPETLPDNTQDFTDNKPQNVALLGHGINLDKVEEKSESPIELEPTVNEHDEVNTINEVDKVEKEINEQIELESTIDEHDEVNNINEFEEKIETPMEQELDSSNEPTIEFEPKLDDIEEKIEAQMEQELSSQNIEQISDSLQENITETEENKNEYDYDNLDSLLNELETISEQQNVGINNVAISGSSVALNNIEQNTKSKNNINDLTKEEDAATATSHENIKTLFDENDNIEDKLDMDQSGYGQYMEEAEASRKKTNIVAPIIAFCILSIGAMGSYWAINKYIGIKNIKNFFSKSQNVSTTSQIKSIDEFDDDTFLAKGNDTKLEDTMVEEDSLAPNPDGMDASDLNQSISNIFDDTLYPVTISKIAWEVPDSYLSSSSFKKYLNIAGVQLQRELQTNLAKVNDVSPSGKVKLSFKIYSDNSIKDIKILETSGVDDIDKISKKCIIDTLTYIKIPVIPSSENFVTLTLAIIF